jgi:hypothetical protein
MMKKGGKGKKGKKIVTDLDSFNAAEQAPIKTSEKDIDHKQPDTAKSHAPLKAVVEVNPKEEEVSKFNPASLDFAVPSFYHALDNKLIDVYFANRADLFAEDEKDLLEAEEFLHFVRTVNRDLEYLLHLKFTQFWGLVSKTPEISRFLDELLVSVRKSNDIFKVQHFAHYEESYQESTDLQSEIRVTMNHLLSLVLQVYFRLSLMRESEEEYLSPAFYCKIIYDSWIFDMAKLIDIPAIYGHTNPKVVQKLLSNVFDNEKRLV